MPSQNQISKTGLKSVLLRVVAAADAAEVAAVLDELWRKTALAVHQAPETGLVMATAKDPFDVDFHLGEVLVTTAQVTCNGVVGHGMIMGDLPEHALLLAAVEALEESRTQGLLNIVFDFVEQLALRDTRQKQTEARMAAATTVQFESMKKERVDFDSLGG